MAWGRRCEMGCADWPDSADYSKCPLCGEETDRYQNLNPLEADEARLMVSHIKFDEMYDSRCAARGVSTDGPLPAWYVKKYAPDLP